MDAPKAKMAVTVRASKSALSSPREGKAGRKTLMDNRTPAPRIVPEIDHEEEGRGREGEGGERKWEMRGERVKGRGPRELVH